MSRCNAKRGLVRQPICSQNSPKTSAISLREKTSSATYPASLSAQKLLLLPFCPKPLGRTKVRANKLKLTHTTAAVGLKRICRTQDHPKEEQRGTIMSRMRRAVGDKPFKSKGSRLLHSNDFCTKLLADGF